MKRIILMGMALAINLYAIDQNVPSFQEFLQKNNIPFRKDGKIAIPKYFKRVKLDIGLSYNAPTSQYWLNHESNLLVFGFEPNTAAIASFSQGAIKRHPAHGEPLSVNYIGKRFFSIPCALGISDKKTTRFFVTSNDCGCSSIYAPKFFPVEQVLEVPIFPLTDFFDLFPFDTHPVIDYIKIDAQGSDLSIAKSAGPYLSERVIYITLETENTDYLDTSNSAQAIDTYMESIGFMRYYTHDTIDPTYVNMRYIDYLKTHNVTIYQR